MPGEEMEITTDFGHAGFGEDIDIDLDFAVGQPDEDLELADFDQAQEMQNFNSDTRDELMAEGDDASYGMIDADDIDHNETATTVNDIEIDLGDSDETLWQQDVSHEDTFQTIAELDYVESADVTNPSAENVSGGEGSWQEAPVDSVDEPTEVESAQVSAVVATSDNVTQNGTVPPDGVDTQDFGLSEVKEDVGDDHESELENAVHSVTNEQPEAVLSANRQPTEEYATSEQGLHEEHNTTPSDGGGNQGNADEIHEGVQYQTGDNEVSETGHGEDDASEPEEKPSASTGSDHESVGEHTAEEHAERHGLSEQGASEYQLGGDSNVESANDQNSIDQAPEEGAQDHNADGRHSHSDAHDPENEDHDEASTSQEEQVSQEGAAHVEHPLSIATRHEMYISYGQTDYRLFAKSEDDDPNQYFLRDMSALEFSLGQFLSSLREVITDEVSPLDELVMHVDGLGLEFSESSTSDMLEQFTFGDILGLYDKLVKNDGAESAPCLYTYLMVRPNCHQRLMALLDSANSGRGLSEVAVYREVTPDYDEQPDSDGLSPKASPHGDEDEGAYENENSDHARDEADEFGKSEDDDENEQDSPSARASLVEANNKYTEEPQGLGEDADENIGTKVDGNTADEEEIDYSDDEVDPSPLKQDQPVAASEDNIRNESNGLTTTERTDPDLHTSPANGSADAPNSDATSVTATLTGDDKDEIDYSDDDGEDIVGDKDAVSTVGSGAPAAPKLPIDDEITWESENEDAKNELLTAPEQTGQVSPTSGKRPRSDSDLTEEATEQHDVKRRRPS